MIKHLYLFILFYLNPLLSPPEGFFTSNTFERNGGFLIETGGLFNLAKKKTVSLLLKEPTRIKSGNAPAQEVGGHEADDQKQIRTSSCLINHPGSAHTKFYSHNRPLTVLINYWLISLRVATPNPSDEGKTFSFVRWRVRLIYQWMILRGRRRGLIWEGGLIDDLR